MLRSAAVRTGVAAAAAALVALPVYSLARSRLATVPRPLVHAEGPPLGHTGGFSEPTCRFCHTDLDLNAPGGALGVDGFPATYESGVTYRVAIVLMSEDMETAGFQAALRFDTGARRGQQAGTLSAVDDRVMVRTHEDTGVAYAFQTLTGSELAQTGGSVTWEFDWTAPEGSAPIVLHAAANAAGGDNSPFGDLIYVTEGRSEGSTGN